MIDAEGRPLAGASVALHLESRGLSIRPSPSIAPVTAAADGTFTIRNVPPGAYEMLALGAPGTGEIALGSVSVNSADVGVELTAPLRWTASGTVRADSGDLPDAVRSRVRLQGRPVRPDVRRLAVGGVLDANGTFVLRRMVGPSRLIVASPGWFVKAITIDGRHVTDATLDPGAGQDVTGIEIVLTQRPAGRREGVEPIGAT